MYLYNAWRRRVRERLREIKGDGDMSETCLASIEEDDKSDQEDKAEPPSSNLYNKSRVSDVSLPSRETRTIVRHQLNLPVVVEASFVVSHKEWKDIYDRSTGKVNQGWTNVIYRKVCSCDFRCVLAFRRHKFALKNSRKKNSFFVV